jgi:hypothetical protein
MVHCLFIRSQTNSYQVLEILREDQAIKRFVLAHPVCLRISLHHFMGISVKHQPIGLFLSQLWYTMEIIERAGSVDSKPCIIPVNTSSKLFGDIGDPISNPTHYLNMASALQYMTFTRPDISYVVQQVCLHMHDPREPHMTALK